MIIKFNNDIMFSFIKKAFNYQSGVLTLIATPLSVAYNELWALVFTGVEPKEIALPFLISGTLLISYFVVTAIDFYTGLSASRKEHIKENGTAKGYIQSDKLWSSIWKFLAVILIGFLLLVFDLVFIAIENGFMSKIFLYGMTLFYIVIILFDLHSIGENQQRRYGKKPPIFNFLEDISNAIKKAFIRRIDKTIGGDNNNYRDEP